MPATHVGSIFYDVQLRRQSFTLNYNKTIKDVTTIRRNAAKPIEFKVAGLQGLDAAGRTLSGLSTKIAGFIGKLAGGGIGSVASMVGIVDKLSHGMRRAGDALAHFGQLTAVFSYRLTLLTAPLIAAGGLLGKSAVEFEYALGRIVTQLDISGDAAVQFEKKMHDHIVSLTRTVPLAANDIAQAMYLLVSSLSIPEETALAMLDPISRAAVAGATEAEVMADAGTVILNVYDSIRQEADGTLRLVRSGTEGAIALADATAEQVGGAVAHMYDVIFEAVRRGRADPEEMVTQLGDFVQFAEQAGITLEESMAVYAQATRVTTASQAATWTSNLFRSFMREDTRKVIESWGVDIGQVVEGTGQWETATIGLTEAEKNRKAQLEETVALETMRLNQYIAASESTWPAYIDGLEALYRGEEKRDGINDEAVDNMLRLNKATGDLAELNNKAGQSYRYWTGEVHMRPGIEILQDLADVISSEADETERLAMIQELMGSIRAVSGMQNWIKNMKENVAWSKEWTSANGTVAESFETMVGRIQNKAILLRNDIEAVGKAVFAAYKDQIALFIDGLRTLADRILELPEDKLRTIIGIFAAISALAPVSLIFGTLVIGVGTLISAVGAMISQWSILGVISFFSLFGDYARDAWEAIKAYDFNKLSDLATFFADLALQLGLVKENDVRDILEAFGIRLEKMGSPAVKDFIDAFGGMWERLKGMYSDGMSLLNAFGDFLADMLGAEGSGIWQLWAAFTEQTMRAKDSVVAIFNSFGAFIADVLGATDTSALSIFQAFLDTVSRIKDDFMEWVEAFRLLLQDIEDRKGALGTLVGYLETLWNKVLAPALGWTGEQYEDLGPEGKKVALERGILGLLGGWAAGKAMSFVARTVMMTATLVNIMGIKGGLAGLLGLGSTVAGGTAAAGGMSVLAGASIATIAALAAAVVVALPAALAFTGYGIWRETEERKRGFVYDVENPEHNPGLIQMMQNSPEFQEWVRSSQTKIGDWIDSTFGQLFLGWLHLKPYGYKEPGGGGGGGGGGEPEGEPDTTQEEYNAALQTELDIKREITDLGFTGGPEGEIRPPKATPAEYETEERKRKASDYEIILSDDQQATLQALVDEYRAIQDNIRLERELRERQEQEALAPTLDRWGRLASHDPNATNAPFRPLVTFQRTPEEQEFLRRYQEYNEAILEAKKQLADIIAGRDEDTGDLPGAVDKMTDAMIVAEFNADSMNKQFLPLIGYTKGAADGIDAMSSAAQRFADWVNSQDFGSSSEDGKTPEQACVDAGGTWRDGHCVWNTGTEFQHGGLVLKDMNAKLHKNEVVFNPRYPRADLAAIVAQSMGSLSPSRSGGGVVVTMNPVLNIDRFSGSQEDIYNLEQAFNRMTYQETLNLERKLRQARRDEDRRRW